MHNEKLKRKQGTSTTKYESRLYQDESRQKWAEQRLHSSKAMKDNKTKAYSSNPTPMMYNELNSK